MALRPGIRTQLRRREAAWGAGGGELVARRSTNVIRFHGQTSLPSKGEVRGRCDRSLVPRWVACEGSSDAMGWLTTGCRDVVVRGLGIPAWRSDGAIRPCRRQRRHSTVEIGESRWREGRQESGGSRKDALRKETVDGADEAEVDREGNRTAQVMPLSGATTVGTSPQGEYERSLHAEVAEATRPSHRETTNWRAVCGKSARTVRREGRPERAVSTPIVTSPPLGAWPRN